MDLLNMSDEDLLAAYGQKVLTASVASCIGDIARHVPAMKDTTESMVVRLTRDSQDIDSINAEILRRMAARHPMEAMARVGLIQEQK